MNKEEIKKMIADDFDNFINERLDGAIIFKYISNLEKENLKLKEQLQQKEDVINKVKEFVKKHNERAGKLYYKYDNKYLLSEIREDLLKILDNKGE